MFRSKKKKNRKRGRLSRRARRAAGRESARQIAPAVGEPLEPRLMLSVTTVGSVTDSDVLFQAANQNMWQRGSSDLIQYNLEWSACDESWDEGTVMRKSGKIG